LDLDDDHLDRDAVLEKDDDRIGAVFGGLDLGQVDRGEASLSIVRKRLTQHLRQHLWGERGTVLEEVHEDLMGHRGHGCDIPPSSPSGS